MTAEAIAGVARATRPGILRAENAASICGAHMRGVREEGWKIHGLSGVPPESAGRRAGAVIRRMVRKRSVVKGRDFAQAAFRGGPKPQGLTTAFMAGALRRHPFVFRLCFVECDRK